MILVSTGVTAKFTTYRQRYRVFEYLNCVLEQIDDKLVVFSIFYIDDESGTTDSTSAHLADSTSSEAVVSGEAVEMSVLHNQSSSSNSVRDPASTTVSSDYEISVEDLMPSLCVDITMLLTFGLASPLFAVIVSFSIVTNTLLWRLALGRYITIVSKATSSHVCYKKLERAFENEWRCLPKTWWMISVFIGMFWSLFVHDMVGDVDPTSGIVAAVLMVAWCPCVFISLQWLLSVNPDSVSSDTSLRSTLDGIRDRIHRISSCIHDIVWKHVLRLDSSISSAGNPRSSTVDESSDISYITSPLRSVQVPTSTAV